MRWKNNRIKSSGEADRRTNKKGMQKGICVVVLFLIIVGAIYYLASPPKHLTSEASNNGFNQVEMDTELHPGDITKSMFTGKGEFHFLTGVVYSGDWKDSRMNGDGTCSYPGVGVYTGEYSDAVRCGTGTFLWENGDSYRGQWWDDSMTTGIYTFTDGSVYKGSFADGKIVDGIFYYLPPQEDAVVQALTLTFKKGQAYSIRYKLSDKFSYDGSLIVGGSATIHYKNGDRYSGNVSNGLREGNGAYTWIENENPIAKYVGSWKEDAMCGEGTYYYTGEKYPTLCGTFKNSLPDGGCTYTNEAGDMFRADFKDGTCISVR